MYIIHTFTHTHTHTHTYIYIYIYLFIYLFIPFFSLLSHDPICISILDDKWHIWISTLGSNGASGGANNGACGKNFSLKGIESEHTIILYNGYKMENGR